MSTPACHNRWRRRRVRVDQRRSVHQRRHRQHQNAAGTRRCSPSNAAVRHRGRADRLGEHYRHAGRPGAEQQRHRHRQLQHAAGIRVAQTPGGAGASTTSTASSPGATRNRDMLVLGRVEGEAAQQRARHGPRGHPHREQRHRNDITPDRPRHRRRSRQQLDPDAERRLRPPRERRYLHRDAGEPGPS